MAEPSSADPLAEGILAGDRRALARAITLVESTRTDHRDRADELLTALLPRTGDSLRIGISGPPGVGKSTFIEAIGLHIVESGHRLAVLAVDPSSNRTGGSILGDKTRMPGLSRHPNAYIRPSPGGGELGGVARRTREAMLVCEAAGFDVVIVETIGVGQSEVAVAEMVDAFTLLVNPGGGDELQGIKRGIMELADIVVVNKADGDLAPAAARSAADHRNAVHLLRPRWRAWATRVLTASAVEGTGVAEVWEALGEFRSEVTASGELEANRAHQSVAWFWSEVRSGLVQRLREEDGMAERLAAAEADVAEGRMAPVAAARSLLR